MASQNWELLFVLPNLAHPLRHIGDYAPPGISLGLEQIAIVSSLDDRVRAIRERYSDANVLLNAFRSEVGKQYDPAVLIVREDVPFKVRQGRAEAVVAFRNAAAFAYLLMARARMIRGVSNVRPTWSDTFDFHPTTLDRFGRLVTVSPALMSFGIDAEAFSAMPSPHLPEESEVGLPDLYLLRVLGREWEQRYLHDVDDERGRALFRSLETAYLACSVGSRNQASYMSMVSISVCGLVP